MDKSFMMTDMSNSSLMKRLQIFCVIELENNKLMINLKVLLTILFSLLFISISICQVNFERNPVLAIANQGGYAIGDIDSDGDLDILTISYENYISWYENLNGLGSFAEMKFLFEAGPNFNYIDLGDMEGDGDLDILVTSTKDDQIAWYENNGQGLFGDAKIPVQNIDSPSQFRLVDIDNDGDMDLVGHAFGDEQVLLFINTAGIFGPPMILTNSRITNFEVGDIDNDGDEDLLISYYNTDEIYWVEHLDGAGSFGPKILIPANSNGPSAIDLADLDGDGDLDVIANSTVDKRLFWNENLGEGVFETQKLISSESLNLNSILAVDLDNDNDLDLLSSNRENNLLGWYENINGLGGFGPLQEVFEFEALGKLFVGDFNGDSRADVLALGLINNSIGYWLRNSGAGNFSSPNRLVHPGIRGYVSLPYTADLDSDGDLDILFSTSEYPSLGWSENLDGQGSFANYRVINNEEGEQVEVAAGDLDNDGDIDVVSVGGSGDNTVQWFENVDGRGNFGSPQEIGLIGNTVVKLAVFDVDNDGDMDIVSARRNGLSTNYIYLHTNEGAGVFDQPQALLTYPGSGANSRISDFDHQDLDGDGLQDLVVSSDNLLERSKIVLLRNQSVLTGPDRNASFSDEQVVTRTNTTISSLRLTDIDSDGDVDLIFGTNGDLSEPWDLNWLENEDGLGNFGPIHEVTDQLGGNVKVHSADLDNDGDVDLLSTSKDNNIQHNLHWYENLDGQGNFGSPVLIDNDFSGVSGVLTADLDNNGSSDIISVSITKVNWYKSDAIGKNRIEGKVLLNVNNDDCASSQEPVPSRMISTVNGNDTISTFSAPALGSYFFNLLEGSYQTFPIVRVPYFSVTPVSASSTFIGLGAKDTINFCYSIEQEVNDLAVTIIPSTEARLGFQSTYNLICENKGSTVLDGTVKLEFDETKMAFLAASKSPTGQTSNAVSFEIENLGLFESQRIRLDMTVLLPPAVNPGDNLTFIATVIASQPDAIEENNVFILDQPAIGSYDPNDITVFEGEEILEEEVPNFLHYLIRFQNTGNAEAIDVSIDNVLDERLNWQTLEMIDGSHSYKVEISGDKKVTFVFDNIFLPDSTTNLEASQGYVCYRIKPYQDIQVGESIYNEANIFFDLNPAIVTNEVETTVVKQVAVSETKLSEKVIVHPNPSNGAFQIDIGELVIDEYIISDVQGQIISQVKSPTPFETNFVIDKELASGVYYLELNSSEVSIVKTLVVTR